MNGETTIRPLQPGDWDALCDFQSGLHERLRASPSLTRSYYHWKFFDRPGLPSCHGAFVDGKLQAVLGTLPFDLVHGTDRRPCGWICDWYVSPSARRKGLGRQLLASAAELFPSLACINGSDEAQDIYRAQGFRSAAVGQDLRWVARPLQFEWLRRRGFRKIEAVFKVWKHSKPGDPGNRDWKPAANSTSESYPNIPTMIGMERNLELIAWLMRAPVGRIEIWQSAAGSALVAFDDDFRGLARARILDMTATGVEAWMGLAHCLAKERDLVYLDAIGPLPLAHLLAESGWIPGHERTVWLRGKGTEDFPLEHWHIGLMDKDNAFRYGKLVP